MTPAEQGLVVVQFLVTMAVGWTVGSLVLARFFPDADVGLPERGLAAVGGAVAFSMALMLVHMATGGGIFSNPFVVPIAGLAVLALGVRRRVWDVKVPWWSVAIAATVLLALYVVPMFLAGSTVREGDPPWHMGWTEELLGGLPIPDGPAPEFARNAYPWGWHAVLATVTRLVPASTPLLAHEALQIVLVFALPLAAACLARRVRRDAGWFAAAAGALIAGFGWVTASDFDFVATPLEARYGADMVVASPNSVYEMFPPALPREMGIVLLALGGTLMLMGIGRVGAAPWVTAGVVTGFASLVSFPMMIPTVMWATAAALCHGRGRVKAWLQVVAPAVALFALWFGPLVFWYLQNGGFVDVVPVLGVEWPLGTALAAWGLLFPLTLAGILVVGRERSRLGVAMLGFAAASIISIGLAIARREFGWTLQGNETLLHQGRMWPVAHLLGAAFAGAALAYLYRWAGGRSRWLGPAGIVLIFAVGALSLLRAAPGLTELIGDRDKGFVYADEDVDAGSFAREAAEHLSQEDVVRVEGSHPLAFKLFEFSGASLAEYDDPRLEDNELRIRYRDLAESYEARMSSGGFVPTHVVSAPGQAGGKVLAEGEYRGRQWVLTELVIEQRDPLGS